MLSTLRLASRSPLLARRPVPTNGLGAVAPLQLRRQVPVLWLAARLCSSEGGPQKPPKGFERFYRQTERKAEEQGGKEAGKTESKGDGKAQDAKDKGSGPSEKAASKGGASSGGSKSGKGPANKIPEQPTPETMRQMIAAAVVTMMLIYMYGDNKPAREEITIQEMIKEYLIKGEVEKVQIVNNDLCRVYLRSGKELQISLGNLEVFEAKVEQVQRELGLSPLDFVPIQYVTETSFMDDILPHLPTLLIFALMMGFARSMMAGGMPGAGGGGMGGGRNPFNVGKAFPKGTKDLKSKVKFSDVAGMEQAKKEVVEFVDFLKNPSKYEHLGAKCPKGGLLVGPPGTGKTLLAKAVAGEADCPFYSMSGSDFIEMFVGVGPSRVRDLFQQARATAPSIIFIDEIDAVGRKRGKGGFSGGGSDERENTLNQMLVEMDGFASGTGVVVLAGTNRADILDNALTRPGRFDRQIAIDKPDLAERRAIFLVHLKPVTLAEHPPVEDFAQRMAALTPGFAGADIANICNEAAIFAARRNAEAVEMQDFELATERVIGGLPKQNGLMSPEEKRAVALHESGHAIAGWFLEHTDPLLKVSIVPRSGGALGYAQYLPDEIRLHSREAILDRIAMALGGRAAEEIFVGAITTGASDDLDKVTKMAYSMVTIYGMNPELGLVSYAQDNSRDQFYKPYSEAIAQTIDKEARALVEEQYGRVKDLLNEKKDMMLSLSSKLEEQETLVYHDIREVLGERPFGIKEAYSKFVNAGSNPFAAKETSDEVSAESKVDGEGEASDEVSADRSDGKGETLDEALPESKADGEGGAGPDVNHRKST